MSVSLDGYGQHLFKGAVAAPYLEKVGLSKDTIESGKWTTDGNADKVAEAVRQWAVDNGASVYCHWFQPLGASGCRHGQSAQVQNHFFEFDNEGRPQWDFKGKNLLKGETDGSSYPNGGLRATHCAGGYLAVDPTSPIFLRGDTIFIPSALVSYYGHALDEKTPLLRAMDAISREGSRLLNLLGFKTEGLSINIGLEQEFFFVPRDAFMRRPDLQLAGRTVIGKMPARGQEMCDHYMGPPSLTSPALACMQEIQQECFKLGIPLRTRHREVAPNQYEFAPLFGLVTTQIDQNLVVMQIIEEVAVKYGLAALLQEKPFAGVNGSGKHNNWSIATKEGTNLLNVGQLAKNSGSSDIFPVIMSALVSGIDKYGDLMRMAIASPGNDFRLGACEAPPAIVSTYLGDDMTKYLEGYRAGDKSPYTPGTKLLDMGASAIAPVEVPAEDRNRTSPFPYGGHRFEFRAVGSSQNVSLVNTVLATMAAKSFKDFADAIEKGETPNAVAIKALNDSWKCIFNGDNYDAANQEMLTKAGVWRIDSGVDAMCRYTEPKNVALFEEMKVLSAEECAARQSVLLSHYVGSVEIEVLTLIDMIKQNIIPSVKDAGVGPLAGLESAAATLEKDMAAIHHTEDEKKKADMARTLRLETMEEVRKVCDEAEGVVPAEYWTLATYKDLLFLDQTHME
jgi:glutamine synthetase